MDSLDSVVTNDYDDESHPLVVWSSQVKISQQTWQKTKQIQSIKQTRKSKKNQNIKYKCAEHLCELLSTQFLGPEKQLEAIQIR